MSDPIWVSPYHRVVPCSINHASTALSIQTGLSDVSVVEDLVDNYDDIISKFLSEGWTRANMFPEVDLVYIQSYIRCLERALSFLF